MEPSAPPDSSLSLTVRLRVQCFFVQDSIGDRAFSWPAQSTLTLSNVQGSVYMFQGNEVHQCTMVCVHLPGTIRYSSVHCSVHVPGTIRYSSLHCSVHVPGTIRYRSVHCSVHVPWTIRYRSLHCSVLVPGANIRCCYKADTGSLITAQDTVYATALASYTDGGFMSRYLPVSLFTSTVRAVLCVFLSLYHF